VKSSFSKIFSSFWLLQIGGWLAYWLMIVITFLPVLASDRSVFALFQLKFIRALIGFGLSSIVRLIYRKFSDSSISAIFLVAVIGSVLTGSLWTILMNFYYWITSATFQLSGTIADFPRNSLDYSATILGWSAIYFGWKIWQKWQKEQANALQSAALADKAQLEMLRYQLNPHFLFNALNSIRASIDEDQVRAKQMITEFSEFLRFSLLQTGDNPIPLGEEIEAIGSYLEIEKIRFDEKLSVKIDMSREAEKFLIPPFLIHPLIENAVKHGKMNDEKPLEISLSAIVTDHKKLIVEIINSGNLADKSGNNGTKIGLKNVSERLEKIFAEQADFKIWTENEFVHAKIEITK
jgi:two-component system, LytTR family, sensor kinase